jgi:hypothetical protein
VGFVVDKVALREVGLQELQYFFLSMSLHQKPHTHNRLDADVIRTSGRSLGTSEQINILADCAVQWTRGYF